jgi:hypothetical protein
VNYKCDPRFLNDACSIQLELENPAALIASSGFARTTIYNGKDRGRATRAGLERPETPRKPRCSAAQGKCAKMGRDEHPSSPAKFRESILRQFVARQRVTTCRSLE